MAIVSEGFARLAVVLEAFKDRRERRHNIVFVHEVLEHEVQSVPKDMAADEDGELIAAASDQADVALVRAHAAVWATGHAHAQLLIFQPEPPDLRLKAVNNGRQEPLGL